MVISEAQKMVGNVVELSYRDKRGEALSVVAEVFDVGFVSLYGPCLITDVGEIRLDRVDSWCIAQKIRRAA